VVGRSLKSYLLPAAHYLAAKHEANSRCNPSHASVQAQYITSILLERNETRRVSSTDTGSSVLDRSAILMLA
jgi:hypothetical protein